MSALRILRKFWKRLEFKSSKRLIGTSRNLSNSEDEIAVKSTEKIKENVICVGIDKSNQTIQSALLSIIDSSYYNRYIVLVDTEIYDISDSNIDFFADQALCDYQRNG